jgi:hypothetical protein
MNIMSVATVSLWEKLIVGAIVFLVFFFLIIFPIIRNTIRVRKVNRETARYVANGIVSEAGMSSRQRFITEGEEEVMQFIYLILGSNIENSIRHLIWARVTIGRSSFSVTIFCHNSYPPDDEFVVGLEEEIRRLGIATEVVYTDDQPNLEHTGVKEGKEIIF